MVDFSIPFLLQSLHALLPPARTLLLLLLLLVLPPHLVLRCLLFAVALLLYVRTRILLRILAPGADQFFRHTTPQSVPAVHRAGPAVWKVGGTDKYWQHAPLAAFWLLALHPFRPLRGLAFHCMLQL
jgi:hypothetical protein